MARNNLDPITHVIVLMLENRSFDQMLGAFSAVYPNLSGIDAGNPYSNQVSGQDAPYFQKETRALSIDPDPKHELKHVLFQIDKLSELPKPKHISRVQWFLEWFCYALEHLASYLPKKKLPMRAKAPLRYEGNFVLDYATEFPQSTRAQREQIMGYYPLDFLAALHALAHQFTICDHWHSSVPGPTWANRFFVHSGTAAGRVWMPEHPDDLKRTSFRPYLQDTIYDRLRDAGKKWRIYFGDIPQSFALAHQTLKENVQCYRPMSRFYEDAAGDADSFPDYCFIEPSYFRTNANDDHPPHNTMHAQCLIADVYNALRKNTTLWQSSLLVILYDEHGGFFDHIEPEPIDPPDEHTDEYTFNRLGVRVPALLISPWVAKHVHQTRFDHTSLLKYVVDKWHLPPLYNRIANATSIRQAFGDVDKPRLEVLPEIVDSPEMAAARREPTLPDAQLNGNQIYLLILSAFLSTLLDAESRSAKMMTAPQTAAADEPMDVVTDAKRTVDVFIQQESAKAIGPA